MKIKCRGGRDGSQEVDQGGAGGVEGKRGIDKRQETETRKKRAVIGSRRT